MNSKIYTTAKEYANKTFETVKKLAPIGGLSAILSAAPTIDKIEAVEPDMQQIRYQQIEEIRNSSVEELKKLQHEDISYDELRDKSVIERNGVTIKIPCGDHCFIYIENLAR